MPIARSLITADKRDAFPETSNMNYLYAPEKVADRENIYRNLYEAIGNENQLAMFPDIEKLSARLRNFNNPEIITLLAIEKRDLPKIIDIKDLFLDAAVIILLSDEDQETYDLAIRLRPKFLGVMNGDVDNITSVVKKLIQKKQSMCSL